MYLKEHRPLSFAFDSSSFSFSDGERSVRASPCERLSPVDTCSTLWPERARFYLMRKLDSCRVSKLVTAAAISDTEPRSLLQFRTAALHIHDHR